MSTRPSRNSPSRRRGMHRRRVTGVPGRAFARRNSSTNCPINHSQVRRGSSGERFGDAGGPGRGASPRSGRLHSDGHLDRLDGAGPIQNGVGGASLTARTRLSTASPGRPPAAAARWFQWHAEAGKAGRPGGNPDVQLVSVVGAAAIMAWWGILQARVVQIPHRKGVEAAWHRRSHSPR
jgi:hypothetical protein